jgi:hypothetical protein
VSNHFQQFLFDFPKTIVSYHFQNFTILFTGWKIKRV